MYRSDLAGWCLCYIYTIFFIYISQRHMEIYVTCLQKCSIMYFSFLRQHSITKLYLFLLPQNIQRKFRLTPFIPSHTSIYLFPLFFPPKPNPSRFFKDSSRLIHRIYGFCTVGFFLFGFFFVRFVHENATKYCTCVYLKLEKKSTECSESLSLDFDLML